MTNDPLDDLARNRGQLSVWQHEVAYTVYYSLLGEDIRGRVVQDDRW